MGSIFDFLFSIFVVSSMGCWTGPGFNCQLIVSIIVASHFKAERLWRGIRSWAVVTGVFVLMDRVATNLAQLI